MNLLHRLVHHEFVVQHQRIGFLLRADVLFQRFHLLSGHVGLEQVKLFEQEHLDLDIVHLHFKLLVNLQLNLRFYLVAEVKLVSLAHQVVNLGVKHVEVWFELFPKLLLFLNHSSEYLQVSVMERHLFHNIVNVKLWLLLLLACGWCVIFQISHGVCCKVRGTKRLSFWCDLLKLEDIDGCRIGRR